MPENGAPTGFKACSAHPRTPAIRDCLGCGKPICRQCQQKSGDPNLCPECKITERLTGKIPDPSARENRENGNEMYGVIIGEVDTAVANAKGTEDSAQQIEAITSLNQNNSDESEPVSKQPGHKLFSSSVPDDNSQPRESAVEADSYLGTEGVILSPDEKRQIVEESSEAPELPGAGSETTSIGTEPSRKTQIPTSERRSARSTGPKTSVWSQLIFCVPYGAAVGAAVVAFWVMLAWMATQWTQLSVITLGLIVPWAMVDRSTKKRYWGKHIRRRPPKPIYIAVPSFITVAVLTIIMELLARQVIFGSKFSIDDFMTRYFSTTEWIVVIAGLLLAWVTPYLMNISSLQGEYRGPRNRVNTEFVEMDELPPRESIEEIGSALPEETEGVTESNGEPGLPT